jgi:protein O-GlcNAc transferase
MPELTLQQAMETAVQHHRAGRLSEAEEIYRQVVAQLPDFAPAVHCLGLIALQRGHGLAAVELIHRAITLTPGNPIFHSNLGEAYRRLGRVEDAIASQSKAIALKPDLAQAHNNLGNALKDRGDLDAAVRSFSKAVAFQPEYAEAYNNLGNALTLQGKPQEAVTAITRALQLNPQLPEAYTNLGTALWTQGKLVDAVIAYRKAISFKPDLAGAHYNLGLALADQGKLDEAAAAYSKSIELNPRYADAYSNLGIVLGKQGKLADAAAAYSKAIELNPELVEAHNNLGVILMNQADVEASIACYDRAIALQPDRPGLLSNRIYTLYFHPDFKPEAIADELRRWNEKHAKPLEKFIEPHANDSTPDRRLKIGYVSPDFREHPVGWFLLPLLEAHNHAAFQIVCYADVRVPDSLTQRFRGHADLWRNIAGLSDEQVAQQIRDDQIDILVDTTMHMAQNRLPVFARKPAPVQATWLAYPGSTGMDTMDYRITDSHLDPPGQNDAYYAEESIRLPDCWCCYRPHVDAPQVNPLPATTAGHITFGCLNNFCKVTTETIQCWCRLMREVPGSRLILHAPQGGHRQRVRDLLTAEGIDPDRMTFVGRVPVREYLRLYQTIDIGLDPFPYSGGTTSCDALWMGVPVVTMSGKTAASRGTLTLLHTLGLSELVAESQDEYVQIASDLAGDPARLSQLRAALRPRMASSPLTDAPRFARNMEAAFLEVWRTWCATKVPGASPAVHM